MKYFDMSETKPFPADFIPPPLVTKASPLVAWGEEIENDLE